MYLSFGKMNPPSAGHGKLLDKLSSLAGKNPHQIYLSQSQDPKKNPLSYETKIKFARKMFPKHSRHIISSKNHKNILDVSSKLYEEGHIKVVVVVGADRVSEFKTLLNKYNGIKSRHGFYKFRDIKVMSAGEGDPDSEGAEGISASKMRKSASDNDFIQFSQGLPKNFSNPDSKSLFNAVRLGMNLDESTDFRSHIQLSKVSAVRELYVEGNLFKVGDTVVIKESGEIGEIKKLGPNYVIIESNLKTYRKWLDAVEKVDNSSSMYDDKPDWGTSGSTEKAKMITPGEDPEFKNSTDIDDKKPISKVRRLKGAKVKRPKLKYKENPYD
jgi:hypothetical protein